MTTTKNNLYTIKDVSEITGVHAQTLRNWEKDDLIEPIRVAGNQRIYTDQHIERINQILELKEEGLQLKGVRNILLGKAPSVKRKVTKTTSRKKATEQPLMTAAQTLEKPTAKKNGNTAATAKKTTRTTRTAKSKYNVDELNQLTLKELTRIAQQEGVKYFRQMFKEELVIAIAYPERREEMKEQAKERTKQRYGHKVYGERARTVTQRTPSKKVQYAQKQQTTKSSRVADNKNIEKEGLVEANVVQDAQEEMDAQQLLIQQILNLGEQGKTPAEIAKKLAEAYK